MSIDEYLQSYQTQLLHIDDLKDEFIKSIFGKKNNEE